MLLSPLGVGQLAGHHSQALYTNADGAISITGVVRRLEFTNPHSFIYVEVTGTDGKTKLWALELMSMRGLTMLGWTIDTVKPGDVIMVAGRPAKNGAPAMYAEAIKLPDGRSMRS
jgi:hypothetical protein